MRSNALKWIKPKSELHFTLTVEPLWSMNERNLGVFISNDLKRKNILMKLQQKRTKYWVTFSSIDTDLRKNLNVSTVRPHLEYASVVWNPYLNKTKREHSKTYRTKRDFEFGISLLSRKELKMQNYKWSRYN